MLARALECLRARIPSCRRSELRPASASRCSSAGSHRWTPSVLSIRSRDRQGLRVLRLVVGLLAFPCSFRFLRLGWAVLIGPPCPIRRCVHTPLDGTPPKAWSHTLRHAGSQCPALSQGRHLGKCRSLFLCDLLAAEVNHQLPRLAICAWRAPRLRGAAGILGFPPSAARLTNAPRNMLSSADDDNLYSSLVSPKN